MRIETHPETVKYIEPWFAEFWEIFKDYDYKLIGAPYGATPMLEAFGIKEYSRPGIEHELIDCIDYADYTLGNSLGIALGMKIAKPDSKIFVFLSDAQLYMGNVMEALTLLKEYRFENFKVLINYNKKGSRELCDYEFNTLSGFFKISFDHLRKRIGKREVDESYFNHYYEFYLHTANIIVVNSHELDRPIPEKYKEGKKILPSIDFYF